MPKHFYSFLQSVGLTLDAAAYLYDLNHVEGIPEEFDARDDFWLLVVETQKL